MNEINQLNLMTNLRKVFTVALVALFGSILFSFGGINVLADNLNEIQNNENQEQIEEALNPGFGQDFPAVIKKRNQVQIDESTEDILNNTNQNTSDQEQNDQIVTSKEFGNNFPTSTK